MVICLYKCRLGPFLGVQNLEILFVYFYLFILFYFYLLIFYFFFFGGGGGVRKMNIFGYDDFLDILLGSLENWTGFIGYFS